MPAQGCQTEGANLPEGLYVVATPIGNLKDITLRALEVLAACDLIACEDTRVSKKLLAHYGITTRTLSLHDHNEREKSPELVKRLQQGARIALISDAGTPLVNDPGFVLLRSAREAGVPVFTIPGPSSILAALSIAGLAVDRFTYLGFLPPKQGARKQALHEAAALEGTLIWLESPERLAVSLADMHEALGNRPAAIARELTKLHEEVRNGTLKELAEYYAQHPPRGEIVILVSAGEKQPVTQEELDKALREALRTGSVREAADAVAAALNLSRRTVYQRALELKA